MRQAPRRRETGRPPAAQFAPMPVPVPGRRRPPISPAAGRGVGTGEDGHACFGGRDGEGSRGQPESMLLSRQPRACQANVLCISLWMISEDTLVNHRRVVDERGCGKVDNQYDAQPHAGHGPLPLSTGGVRYPQPVCGACYYSAGMPSTFHFSGVADVQLRPGVREYLTVYGCVRALTVAVVAVRDNGRPSASEAAWRSRRVPSLLA